MKQLLCAIMFLTTYQGNAQNSQWQLCNTNSCYSYNAQIIAYSDTLFSAGCFSVDGGSTWFSLPLSIAFGIDFYVSNSSGIFAGGESKIYHSSDNGISWTVVHNFGSICYVRGMVNLNDSIFVATWYQGIWMSPDNGLTWNAVNSGLPTDSIYSILAMGNRLYAGTIDHGIYISDNSGASWTAANNGLPAISTVGYFTTDYINIYISTSSGLYYTNIGSTYWNELIFPNPTTTIIYCIDNVILAGGYNNLYRSLDQGLTWHPFDAGLPDTCIYFINSFYATDSLILCGFGDFFCQPEIFKMDRNLVALSLDDIDSYNEIQINVYPNPFNDQISFETNTDINSTIKLYDVAKRLITQQYFFRQTTVNTSKLENGVYFYEVIMHDGRVKSGKMLKN